MSQLALTRSAARIDGEVVARCGAAAALLGSAVVHSTVVSEHFAHWQPAGMFFVGLQLVETLLAIAVVLAWTRLTQLAVVLTSVGTVLVWAASRTVGMPFGPAGFRQPEAVGVSDLACCVLELAAAALVAPWVLRGWSSRQPVRRNEHRRAGTWLLAGLLVAAAAAVTGWGLLPAVGQPATAELHDTPSHHTH